MSEEPLLEFLIQGTAVSAQASSRSKRGWKTTVEKAARTALPEGHFHFHRRLCITIYLFPQAEESADIDNCAKPILDAMNSTVYSDDQWVSRLVMQKFEPEKPDSITIPISKTLVAALDSDDPVVYVRVRDILHGE